MWLVFAGAATPRGGQRNRGGPPPTCSSASSGKKATDVRALATGFAALVEKDQLLDGAVTARVEEAEGERHERVQELRDQLAERRAARRG